MGYNITVLKNWSQKWITNLEKTIVIEFDFFSSHEILYTNLAAFWPNFYFMTSQGLLNFKIVQKWRKIKFFNLKNIHGSKFRTALKNWESDVKERSPFHTFLQIFYKHFNFSVKL